MALNAETKLWDGDPISNYQLISDPWRHASMASSGNLPQGVLADEGEWHWWNYCVFMFGGLLFHWFLQTCWGLLDLISFWWFEHVSNTCLFACHDFGYIINHSTSEVLRQNCKPIISPLHQWFRSANECVWPCFDHVLPMNVFEKCLFSWLPGLQNFPKNERMKFRRAVLVDAGISGFMHPWIHVIPFFKWQTSQGQFANEDQIGHYIFIVGLKPPSCFFFSRGILPNTWDYLSIFEVKPGSLKSWNCCFCKINSDSILTISTKKRLAINSIIILYII